MKLRSTDAAAGAPDCPLLHLQGREALKVLACGYVVVLACGYVRRCCHLLVAASATLLLLFLAVSGLNRHTKQKRKSEALVTGSDCRVGVAIQQQTDSLTDSLIH